VADAAAARRPPRFGGRARGLAAAVAVILGASCAGPTKPTPPSPPPPPVVDPATPPIIRSIDVPSSRVEAGTTVVITAVVEDAETPLAQLAFQWTASSGAVTGSGATATWQIPKGMTAGVDVVITLTVVDTYDAVVNNVVVKQQFVVARTAPAFRVHDSNAEVKELARKFLEDLFGDTSVPPEACMVDFADVCANFGEGKINELEQIVSHRASVVLTNAQVLNQNVVFFNPGFGTVHSATLYTGHLKDNPFISSGCGDYELTMVYINNRWWICESYFHPNDVSFCPGNANSSEFARRLREILTGRGKLGDVRPQ
jgi:hypothetical protein